MAATVHGGAWSYAVPLDETDGNARPAAQRADTAHWDNEREKPSAKNVQRRSSAWDLMSDSETTKQRRSSMRQSNTMAGRKRSKNQLRDTNTKRPQEEKPPERVDDSAWIHRDKLAAIEIQEMAEAGFYRHSSRRSESEGPARHRTSRSMSRPRRSASRTDQERQHEITTDEDYAAAYPGNEESPRKRVSTVPSAPEEDHDAAHELPEEPAFVTRDFDPYRDSQFHAAEEITARLHAQRQQQQTLVRPGTSRIPVSRVSPVPVPPQVVDRDSPLPRSRAGSQNWGSGSFDEMQYARKIRSGSMSSQVLLDSDLDHQKSTPPGSLNKNSSNEEPSPPKSQIPKKSAPTGRTASAASGAPSRPGSSHQNKRGTSTSGARRPGSSSGHKSRPSAGYPTDGEAPWISSMYKPDPRLPPDQQMLPTHAKRMMQEQWEREGKPGTAYDREFNQLNDDEFPKPSALTLDSRNLAPPQSPSPTKDKPSPTGSANGGPWPLSPTKSDNRSDAGSVRPGTSGGYKITPTIPDTPTIHRSPLPSPGAQTSMPAHNPTPRVPELNEKDEAAPKKGCCCVVM